jgi:lysophospholipase L1-like esterase
MGDWRVQVTVSPPQGTLAASLVAVLDVPPPAAVTVTAEKHASLPVFDAEAAGWRKGTPLEGVRAQECTSRDLLEPQSLEVRCGPTADSLRYQSGQDYRADLIWGTVGRLAGGRISGTQPVYLSYRYTPLRIDSVVLTRDGRIVLRTGNPHPAVPLPAAVAEGERRLANIWIAGRLARLTPDQLFPILESVYPEPPRPTPTEAERLLPKTMQKLRQRQPLRILAWGDSVTVGTFVPDPQRNRWQAQFVSRLGERFPQAKIELLSEAWGGRNTASYLAEPPGSPHNYMEKVLGAKPDLVVSEFFNDGSLKPAQVEDRYSKLLADFRKIGAEWIILTPHYGRPDWMRLTREREIDDDPRPYVAGLRQFAAKHQVALADASLRWGRLWRQGIPYRSLLLNSINHPDARGMKLFADSLIWLFP